jgi:hypothetical protein
MLKSFSFSCVDFVGKICKKCKNLEDVKENESFECEKVVWCAVQI